MQIKPLDEKSIFDLKDMRNKHMIYLRQYELLSDEDQNNWYREYKKNNNHKYYYIQVMDKIVGYFGLTYIDYINRVAEISFITSEYVNEHSRKLLDEAERIAFDELNMNRVFVEIIEYDEFKKEMLEDNKYKMEGRLRQKYYKNGDYFDSLIYGLLRKEYDARTSN